MCGMILQPIAIPLHQLRVAQAGFCDNNVVGNGEDGDVVGQDTRSRMSDTCVARLQNSLALSTRQVSFVHILITNSI